MEKFLELMFSFPTAVYSVVLSVVLLYWLLAIVGVVDFDHGHIHIELHHADAHELGSFAAIAVALGLDGVPFSVVISLLVFFAWFASALAQEFVLPLVALPPVSWLAGVAVLLGAGVLALPLTAVSIRPLRRIFVTHAAASHASLVGLSCRVVTTTVDEKFGRAEVETRGVAHNVRICASTPNQLRKGSVARILDYDAAKGQFTVIAEPEI
jgi:hypothetical protein